MQSLDQTALWICKSMVGIEEHIEEDSAISFMLAAHFPIALRKKTPTFGCILS